MRLTWTREKHPRDGSPLFILRDEKKGPVATIGRRNAQQPPLWGWVRVIIAPGMPSSGPQSFARNLAFMVQARVIKFIPKADFGPFPEE